jgi:hypothetical protein
VGNSRIFSGLTKTAPFEGYGGSIVARSVPVDLASQWAAGILPAALFSAVGMTAGAWDALLPEDTPDDVANSFTRGVLPEPPVSQWPAFDPDHFGPEMTERMASSMDCSAADLVVVPKASLVLYAAQFVAGYVASSPTSVALVLEMNGRADQWPVVWRSPLGVLYPVSDPGVDRDAVADLMDSAANVTSELVILTSSDGLDPLRSRELSEDELVALCSRADSVVIGAYDGESYVRWMRTVQQWHRADGASAV